MSKQAFRDAFLQLADAFWDALNAEESEPKAAAKPEPEPKAKPEPEPEPKAKLEPESAPEPEPKQALTIEDVRARASQFLRSNRDENRPKLQKALADLGVGRATDLQPDQFEAFLGALENA